MSNSKARFLKVFNQFLFGLHAAIIPSSLLASFLVSPPIVFAGIAVHRLHIKLFGGCVITKIQQKTKGLAKSRKFTEELWFKIFHRRPSKQGLEILNQASWVLPLAIAFIRILT